MATENVIFDFLDKMYVRGENMDFAGLYVQERFNLPPIRTCKLLVHWYRDNKPYLEIKPLEARCSAPAPTSDVISFVPATAIKTTPRII